MKQDFFSVGILAGGKSSRMGQNKALMEFQNETMIGRISKAFKGTSEVLVSAAERGVYDIPGIKYVYDEHKDIGPIEGLRQVISAADKEYVFVCAADMPFVNREIAEYLAEFISTDYDCYVIADEERVHPLCAIYSKRVLPVIEELIRKGKYRLMEILQAVRTKYVELRYTNFDRRVVKNVNTKDEFLRLSLPVTLAVSGFKNSGKTGLIEKLINEFICIGFSVGVLKHDGHDQIEEAEGTDTERFRRAGALCTLVYSEGRYLLSAGRGDGKSPGRSPEEMVEELRRCACPLDIILLEGFKYSAYPKVELVRRDICAKSVADPETLICIATDCISPQDVSCPVYGLEDVQGIFSCIIQYFGLQT